LRKKTKDIFQPKSTRVVRVLLTRPGTRWRILNLAKEAEVSLGWAHAVVATLQEQHYVVRDSEYRVTVTDPVRLLKRWAAFHDFLSRNTFETFQVFAKDADDLVARAGLIGVSYAITGLAGAWLVTPHVRPASLDVYVTNKQQMSEISKAMDLHPVEKGGNVRLILPYDGGVFYGSRIVDHLKVVSNVQLYVDLVNYPGRGEEASARLLGMIQDEWSKALTE